MKFDALRQKPWLGPAVVTLAALVVLGWWFFRDSDKPLALRVPGTDKAPQTGLGTNANAVLAGKLVRGDGTAAELPGSWPQFRGPNLNGISPESTPLARNWGAGEPRELWAIDVGEGYAGPAVFNGRVYLMDYDREKKQDALRCLSLADGREIWRFTYPVAVKRNHGMSRTVPVVTEQHTIAMGPKCHVVCVDSTSGELRWGIDLVQEYGTTVPPWYAAQCPIIENGAVILAPAGSEVLLMAVDVQTGKPLWQTINQRGWKMTHSSIVPVDWQDQRIYVYCADKGVVGVSAKDGQLLWETTDWKISIATVPSPIPLENGRIFLSGGYNAGSMMLQLKMAGEQIVAEPEFRLPPEIFGATQHTPILHNGYFYGVRPDGRFVCLTTQGKPVWTSGSGQQFGLGPFLMADGVIFAVNDTGLLRMIDATPSGYQLLAETQVLKGREAWGPMALAGGRLLARDLTRLVCLDVGRK